MQATAVRQHHGAAFEAELAVAFADDGRGETRGGGTLPLVYTQIGAVFSTNFKNCDFAVDGIAHQEHVDVAAQIARRPSSFSHALEKRASPAALSSPPKMAGATRERISAITSLNGRAANFLNSVCSASEKCGSPRAPSDSSDKPHTLR